MEVPAVDNFQGPRKWDHKLNSHIFYPKVQQNYATNCIWLFETEFHKYNLEFEKN